MVIDVDDELFFEIDQAGPIYVGAFNNENGIVRAIDRGGYANGGGAGKLLISMRRCVTHGDFDVFVERAQQPVETERGAEAVPVRPDVGGNRKAILFFNEFNYLAKHWWISDCGLRIADLTTNANSQSTIRNSQSLPVSYLFKYGIDAPSFFFDCVAHEVKRGSMPQIEREAKLPAHVRRGVTQRAQGQVVFPLVPF